MKWFRRKKKGAALVELIAILPVLAMIVVGFVYYTILIKEALVIQTAARVGARNYAIYHEASEAEAVARNELARGQVKGARVQAMHGKDSRGMKVEKDVKLKIPFVEIHLFTIGREIYIYPAVKPDDLGI